MKHCCINEHGRLIGDINYIRGEGNIPGYVVTTGSMVTMEIEKSFHSLDYDFLICVLKKFGFGDA